VTAERGSWHWILYVAAYLGAFLTAVYTWRMIFRAFHGEPCPQARELIETGHIHHAHEHRNPANGEIEDTDVGFPGPEHHIAEHAMPMRIAMSVLALGAVGLGLLQVPKLDFVIDDFLAPVFAHDKLYSPATQNGDLVVGLILGTVLGLGGIALAYRIWVQKPGTAAVFQQRFSFLHKLFSNKWYFDELIDLVIVAPGAWFGRFGQQTFERLVVNGALIGGTTGLVKAGSAAVRGGQNGYLRYYAGLVLLGVSLVGLYFLVQT
jgi:NADH-quinone oxidoreductase subunit L